MEENLVLKITAIGKEHTPVAGGKGANLGELSKKAVVPKGFVILSNSFKKFVSYNDLDTHISRISGEHTPELLQKTSKKICEGIFPKILEIEILENLNLLEKNFFAVRSSAVFEDSCDASWAGQLETFTNIKKPDVLQNVKKCWASLFSQRAINYYKNQENKKALEMAVVIQEMIGAKKSGICFTANPVTNNTEEIIIEAGFGLGESVVGGQITPDLYIVDKKSFEIKKIEVNKQEKMLALLNGKTAQTSVPVHRSGKQKLSEKEIKEIAKKAVEIENHYGQPQDTEWAIKGKQLFFLQTRPITTLGKDQNG